MSRRSRPEPVEWDDPDDGSDARWEHLADASLLSREGTALTRLGQASAAADGEQLDREERAALGRVASLSTELTDVTEVEYRQLRLERVVLVGLYASSAVQEEAEVSMRELAALAQTAGSEVLDAFLQRRARPNPSTYLGSGKAQELAELVEALGADTVVVNSQLAPSQRRALEDVIEVKVVDRTAVILDIFAQHAKSKEGKAQVELAQLEYLLPRLRGWGESMSRQGGGRVAGGAGIGSRGPGETKIELDRRRIRTRMARLRRDLAAMTPSRQTRRQSRRRGQVPSVAIVGYTNAGKSSVLNRLTGAGVLVDNTLFATLDPTVRRAQTLEGRQYTLTDTVGFVRDLPHELVEAFRSTLEEVAEADLVLHVVDAAHADPDGQIKAVREVLGQIDGALDVPELIVLNKVDLVDDEAATVLRARHPGAVAVSAHSGEGLDQLRALIDTMLPRPGIDIDLVVPYDRGDLVSKVHERGDIEAEEYRPEGTYLRGRVDQATAAELHQLDQGSGSAAR